LLDEFGRSLGEQVSDQILEEYQANEKRHVLQKEYTSGTSHQDGDLPYRMQITYRDGGPSYHVNDYFPHLHFQAAAALANSNYDHLVEWSGENHGLEEFKTESEAVEHLSQRGAAYNIGDLNLG